MNTNTDTTQNSQQAIHDSHSRLLFALKDIVDYVSPGDDALFAAMIEEAKAALALVPR